MKKLIYFLLFCFLISLSIANAQIPKVNSYVTDNAGVLSSSAKAQLLNEITELEKSTNGVQFVIYIENEYPKSYSLEEYTLKIAEDNKIGKKGNDNGILLYVAVKDRAFRWETGYGVESTLSAPLLGRVSRDYLIPNFKNGDYEKGILDTFEVAKKILLGSTDSDILKLENEKDSGIGIGNKYFLAIFIGMFILLMIFSVIQKKARGSKTYKNDSFYKGAATGLFLGNMGRGRGGFGGSGGFGGFSGGGGGFGGGGFGGKW